MENSGYLYCMADIRIPKADNALLIKVKKLAKETKRTIAAMAEILIQEAILAREEKSKRK